VIPENVKTPDPKKIIIATVSALVTATTITFAFILPAELGKDPLGTGHHYIDL
jgi:hypothetical protein